MKISFFLKEPKGERSTPIIARLAHAGVKTKVYTGLSIEPRQWNQAAQLAPTRGNPRAGRINDTLAAMRERLEACFLGHYAAGRIPTPEELRQALDPAPNPAPGPAPEPTPEPARPTLLAAYALWNEQRRDRLSPNTLRSSATTLKHLQQFQRATGYVVDFDTITPEFAARFTSHLMTHGRLTDNSVAKTLGRLKAFLRYAYQNDLTGRRDFERLKWQKHEPDILVLTSEELGAIEALTLGERPGLLNSRNLFLLACYTGLRFSDLVTLEPEHLQGDSLRLRMHKTRDLVVIPLRPAARELLTRLFAGEIYPVSNAKLNESIKEVGRLAGLDSPVERIRYRGGQRLAEKGPKYRFITCHTARRTFVTLALERRIRPEVVMKVSGHKSHQAFRRYVAVSEQTVQREFGEAFGS